MSDACAAAPQLVMGTLALVPMRRTDDESEFAFALKKEALGAHILVKWPWDEAYQRAVHKDRWSSRQWFRIMQGEVTIGTIAVDQAADHIRLGEFYVTPPRQKQGLGSAVLQSILLWAAKSARPVRLECLKWNPALSFYKRHGFVVTGESEIHFFLEA